MESLNYYKNAVKIIQKLIEAQCVITDADIEFLLDSVTSKLYNCSPITKSSGFSLLHKCVILTGKYPKLNNILRDRFQTNPQFAQSINKTNKEGWTALHLAARNSKTVSTEETVKILLNAGADVNLKTHIGWTALHLAANSKTECTGVTVKLLLDAGADINLKNISGITALHYASYYSRTFSTEETVKILLAGGANVNLQDNIGWTPLHYASCNSKTTSTEETVKILLAAGANVNLQDNLGLTPLQRASDNLITSTEETINILKAAETLKVYDEHIGECVVCYNDSTTFICNYNHKTCLECSTKMQTKFCPICSNEFVRSKLT